MAYLLDTNSFISAKDQHYGFDFCPGFWDWLVWGNKEQKVFSIQKVKDELDAGNDELKEWASQLDRGFFLQLDERTVDSLRIVSEWANGQRYTPAAVSTFLQKADYELVAYALAYRLILVTFEIAANSTRKIKIPDACRGLGIQFTTTYKMLREEQARFVLRH